MMLHLCSVYCFISTAFIINVPVSFVICPLFQLSCVFLFVCENTLIKEVLLLYMFLHLLS